MIKWSIFNCFFFKKPGIKSDFFLIFRGDLLLLFAVLVFSWLIPCWRGRWSTTMTSRLCWDLLRLDPKRWLPLKAGWRPKETSRTRGKMSHADARDRIAKTKMMTSTWAQRELPQHMWKFKSRLLREEKKTKMCLLFSPLMLQLDLIWLTEK